MDTSGQDRTPPEGPRDATPALPQPAAMTSSRKHPNASLIAQLDALPADLRDHEFHIDHINAAAAVLGPGASIHDLLTEARRLETAP